MSQGFSCPFCMLEHETQYELVYHIEEQHTEESPFVPTSQDGPSYARQYNPDASSEHQQSVRDPLTSSTRESSARTRSTRLRCTRPDCGEYIRLEEVDTHLQMHDTVNESRARHEHLPQNESRSKQAAGKQIILSSNQPQSPRSTKRPTEKQQRSLLSCFSRPAVKSRPLQYRPDGARQGTKELGPYAFERSMPSSVRKRLEDAARPNLENRIGEHGRLTKHVRYVNETSDVICSLASLAAVDTSYVTRLCHPATKHIHRVECDGNFCGYWNIQMLLTYILSETSPERGLPTVLQIQETIEEAWSDGICTYGKHETGGIYNTRKWIGTHEALAFFTKIGVTVSAGSFASERGTGRCASTALLNFVEDYFSTVEETSEVYVCITDLAPIYLQRAGHSVTIVGIRRKIGSDDRDLLVLDSSLLVDDRTLQRVKRKVQARDAEAMLQPYLTSESRLARWDDFEVLAITDYSNMALPETA